MVSQYLEGPVLNLFISQLRTVNRTKKQRRWSDELKVICLAIRYQSPKAYRFLREILCLPTVATLRKPLEGIHLEPGMCLPIFDVLKKKPESMTDLDKCCTLVLDEMTIKTLLQYEPDRDRISGFADCGHLGTTLDFGNQALVFMVTGIFSNWKQSVSYVISNEATKAGFIHSLVSDCLQRLELAGLKVKLVICDQGPSNQSLFANFLQVSASKPYFTINGNKVFVMWDPPHLLKSVRNMLHLHDFCLDNDVISWKYIAQMYQIDSANCLAMRLAPKLTKGHITLPPFSKMKVKRAAQVFSSTCYSALLNYICAGRVSSDAFPTANFIKRIDNLFDCFNSLNLYNAKPFKCAMKNDSIHHDFLKDCARMFDRLFYIDSRGNAYQPPCFRGWVLTINSLLQVWDELKMVKGVDFLLTRRLSQDCLENLFSVIRGKGGFRDNPGPKHFRDTLKQTMVSSLLNLSQPDGANCQMDTARYIFDMGSMSDSKRRSNGQVSSTADANSSQCDFALSVNDLPQENILYYVAGVCVKKILKHHGECECVKALRVMNASLQSTNQIFTGCKAYSKFGDVFGALVVPSDNIVNLLRQCDAIFVSSFPQVMHMDRICDRFDNLIYGSVNIDWFTTGRGERCVKVLKVVVRSFIRLRIYYTLKDLNQRIMQAPKRKQNRKLLKLIHM